MRVTKWELWWALGNGEVEAGKSLRGKKRGPFLKLKLRFVRFERQRHITCWSDRVEREKSVGNVSDQKRESSVR